MSKEFFQDKNIFTPRIYAYSDSNPQYRGLLKIGYTIRSAEERIKEQYPTLRPGKSPYRIELDRSSSRKDGSFFTDKEIHNHLRSKGIPNPSGEWFRCNVKVIASAISHIAKIENFIEERSLSFSMRPEQKEAVKKTKNYFLSIKKKDPKKTPHFLWNAKMRFGKTFTAYQLALAMKWKKILVITFKPAVQSAWEEDVLNHKDFLNWQFISKKNKKKINEKKK